MQTVINQVKAENLLNKTNQTKSKDELSNILILN